MPILYKPDCDILASDAQAIVIPVNCEGVMGKGLARAFKDRFPQKVSRYQAACVAERVRAGIPYIVSDDRPGGAAGWIVFAPTKCAWRNPSRIEWVEAILMGLRHFVQAKGVRSIAIPALGCGAGGLLWREVNPLIDHWLGDLGVATEVYAEEACEGLSDMTPRHQGVGESA
jgi:O-acetyl-ADP-ribose deacetylase (regulator of RNase III)